MGDMKVTGALMFIVTLNVLFFFGQTVVTKINPDGPQFFTEDDFMIGDYKTNGTYVLSENVANELPGTEVAVSPETDTGGGYFTDVWSSVKNWLTDTTVGRGVTYVLNIVNAFPHFLSLIGAPKEIVFGLGFLWHSMTVFLIVIFLKGGQ